MSASGAVDCLIIGGGPAGLTAAVYLARFHLSLTLIDAGQSRAASIPITHNQPMFSEGISGAELLTRMREHAALYRVHPVEGKVERLTATPDGFRAAVAGRIFEARSVLLATGVSDLRPAMDEAEHDRAVAQGRLRYCAICDGFEVTDRDVAVFGSGGHGVREVRFLRSYTRRLTLVAPDGAHALDEDERAALRQLDVTILDGPVRDIAIAGETLTFRTPAGPRRFDTAYPALGSEIHSDLARSVGAECAPEGCVIVDSHQRTSVRGLYAAGDVVPGLNQLGAAFGQASVAATAIRNDLAAGRPLLR